MGFWYPPSRSFSIVFFLSTKKQVPYPVFQAVYLVYPDLILQAQAASRSLGKARPGAFPDLGRKIQMKKETNTTVVF